MNCIRIQCEKNRLIFSKNLQYDVLGFNTTSNITAMSNIASTTKKCIHSSALIQALIAIEFMVRY